MVNSMKKYHIIFRYHILLVISLVFFLNPFFRSHTTALSISGDPSVTQYLTSATLLSKFGAAVQEVVDLITGLPQKIHAVQILSKKTHAPLSGQNFKKTRPRGIPAQEPGIKHILLTGHLLNYHGDHLSFFSYAASLLPVTNFRAGIKVRPPPVQALCDLLTV
jgi:hypothetical protein